MMVDLSAEGVAYLRNLAGNLEKVNYVLQNRTMLLRRETEKKSDLGGYRDAILLYLDETGKLMKESGTAVAEMAKRVRLLADEMEDEVPEDPEKIKRLRYTR